MINFAVPVFFICFRETLETSIVVAVLLAFLKQSLDPKRDAVMYKRLLKEVWFGVIAGLIICISVGGAIIGVFYKYGKDLWAGTEDVWEGSLSILAAVIITVMGAALLRVSKMQEKFRIKLAESMEPRNKIKGWNRIYFWRSKQWYQRHSMFFLPFITVLREGLEAVVFIGGVSLGFPAKAFPGSVIAGVFVGILIGAIIWRCGNSAAMQTFLIISTCVLYLVASGLFSKGVWKLQNHKWSQVTGGDAAETGSGPGSYDIRQSVWHINCCSPEVNGGGGWGIFNALLGWQNSATYGSVLSYNIFWVAVSITYFAMQYNEKKGHWPLLNWKQSKDSENDNRRSNNGDESITFRTQGIGNAESLRAGTRESIP